MGLLNIFKTVMKNNVNRDQAKPIIKTLTPLGLHQGSVVTLPEVDLALAEADGSICPPPKGTMVVSAVGKYSLFNMDVYHCYFGYQGTYVQLVTKPGSQTVEQARYWNLRSEIQPTSQEDWEFWLGSWQKDEHGEFVRDSHGIAIKKEDGLIGFPQFQVDTNPPIIYDREWNPGTASVNPIKITEKVLDVTGQEHYIKHEAMEYSRKLSADADSKVESLLASVVEDDSGASINVFIGIPLDHTAIKVLVS
jgi:hypothetical protein